MHPEAYEFIKEVLEPWRHGPMRVIEFGSRDVNGSPRDLFTDPQHEYVGVDIEDGPGVDVVGNAATPLKWVERLHFPSGRGFDIAICAEVFEHTPDWPGICKTAHTLLEEAGVFVVTCATDPRPPHSAVDGHNFTLPDQEGEYYANVWDYHLHGTLELLGFSIMELKTHPRGDLYAAATIIDK